MSVVQSGKKSANDSGWGPVGARGGGPLTPVLRLMCATQVGPTRDQVQQARLHHLCRGWWQDACRPQPQYAILESRSQQGHHAIQKTTFGRWPLRTTAPLTPAPAWRTVLPLCTARHAGCKAHAPPPPPGNPVPFDCHGTQQDPPPPCRRKIKYHLQGRLPPDLPEKSLSASRLALMSACKAGRPPGSFDSSTTWSTAP